MARLFRLFLPEERKQFFEFGGAGLAAVFAELEGLGVLDAAAFFLAVKLDELFPETVGGAAGAAAEDLGEITFFGRALGGVGGHRDDGLEVSGGPKAFDLRLERPERLRFLLGDVIDSNHDVRAERVGLLKIVGQVEEHRVLV